ncbi:hypothetical protein BKA69DRAFT_1123925 [Paraphysoderma sedebokerense]|nr:hypothetical protein BKA69DRAFT_1123925 [Paraphysoderma sedebokerense]
MTNDLKTVRDIVSKFIESISEELNSISLQIHSNPELAFKEYKAYELITSYLESKPGVKLQRRVAGLETAFVAEFDNLMGKKREDVGVVGFCSEYDALPMGHACGHNLIAISGIGAFLTLSHLLSHFSIPGKVLLFGTPGEEGKGGKIYMLKDGVFDGLDACMMLHPGNIDLAWPTYLALQSFEVSYYGKESHAAAAPWEGVNALDAIVNAYNSIACLRQQILPTDRVHGIITEGGVAPNIIPAKTTGVFYTRATKIAHLQNNLLPRVLNCISAGSVSTSCTHTLSFPPPYFDVLTNPTLTNLYTNELSAQLNITLPSPDIQSSISRGSTDMGNVLYAVPGIHNVVDIGCKEEIHTVGFREHAKTRDAFDRMMQRVSCLVLVGFLVASDQNIRKKAKKDWQGDFNAEGLDLKVVKGLGKVCKGVEMDFDWSV